jgi:hypothetical protein
VTCTASDNIPNVATGTFTVKVLDNTPPVVDELSVTSPPGTVEVRGRAEDASSTLTRVEVALDNDDWRTVTPDGGFADERSLGFRARLPLANRRGDQRGRGIHLITYRRNAGQNKGPLPCGSGLRFYATLITSWRSRP